MTEQERKQAYFVIKHSLPHLTDEELKIIVALIVTKETINGTPLKEL